MNLRTFALLGTLAAVVFASATAGARAQTPAGDDVEQQARAIDALLVAPCCFRQQVSVHRSAAADQVRRDVRARLAAGETRPQILDRYVADYGVRILAEPPAAGFDLSLYVMPFVMLFASAGLVVVVLRRFTTRQRSSATGLRNAAAVVPASADDEARLDDALRDLD